MMNMIAAVTMTMMTMTMMTCKTMIVTNCEPVPAQDEFHRNRCQSLHSAGPPCHNVILIRGHLLFNVYDGDELMMMMTTM